MSARELDDRQEHLHRIDTLRSRPGPFWIEPPRHRRPSRWRRLVGRIKALLLRRQR